MISRDALRKYEGKEPENIAEAEGLEILEVDDMPPRIGDMLCLRTIIIRRGLSPAERRWRIAHCLGHHFLHQGNGGNRKHSRIILNPTEEREADVFAGYLIGALMSPGWLNDLYEQIEPWNLEPWELMRQLQAVMLSLHTGPDSPKVLEPEVVPLSSCGRKVCRQEVPVSR